MVGFVGGGVCFGVVVVVVVVILYVFVLESACKDEEQCCCQVSRCIRRYCGGCDVGGDAACRCAYACGAVACEKKKGGRLKKGEENRASKHNHKHRPT